MRDLPQIQKGHRCQAGSIQSKCVSSLKAKTPKGGTRCPHRVVVRTLADQPVGDNGLHLGLNRHGLAADATGPPKAWRRWRARPARRIFHGTISRANRAAQEPGGRGRLRIRLVLTSNRRPPVAAPGPPIGRFSRWPVRSNGHQPFSVADGGVRDPETLGKRGAWSNARCRSRSFTNRRQQSGALRRIYHYRQSLDAPNRSP